MHLPSKQKIQGSSWCTRLYEHHPWNSLLEQIIFLHFSAPLDSVIKYFSIPPTPVIIYMLVPPNSVISKIFGTTTWKFTSHLCRFSVDFAVKYLLWSEKKMQNSTQVSRNTNALLCYRLKYYGIQSLGSTSYGHIVNNTFCQYRYCNTRVGTR